MNDSACVMRQPRRSCPRPARTAAAIIATAAAALLAASCSGTPSSAGSGGSPHAGGSANTPSAVAYSACMRSHGVPNYPDPSDGQLPKGTAQHFGVSSSQFSAARQACQHLLPRGGSAQQQLQQCLVTLACSQALMQQARTRMLHFARCMRSHGVPNWPDPTIGSQGQPVFRVSSAGMSHAYTHSPQIRGKIQECQRLTRSPVALS